ncbi:CocE/NonD family hydrolase [Granulicella cerasi]|uniref:CocE/NonD family hydrolase n=1 Tax=Granulicella cerasi TaxID=741063 RepID=A0ABW1ZAV4_9BACT|nr:CocE/NonD family hydrolase [Granulicella cerasi]
MRFTRTAALALAIGLSAFAAHAQTPIGYDTLPKSFTQPASPAKDYDRRVVMMPMHDGVKLYTVIYVPHGAKNMPIIFTRTPYDAEHHRRSKGDDHAQHLIDELSLADEDFVRAGYIRVYQDVRGKWGSEGAYLMTPPPVDSGFNKTGADDTTDAYDAIDWLVKNVPETNGRVGMIGSSYEGFTVVMALLKPHPALRAAVPESPMVDGWMGDDWYHYGAFRQPNIDYFIGQTGGRVPVPVHTLPGDQYANDLAIGSAGDLARSKGADQLDAWKIMKEHPAYDAFWKAQALDHLIEKMPLTVPTLWEQGLYDQEDMWGAIHSYRAWEPKDKANNMNFITMGPWFHSQVNRPGFGLGPMTWSGDTTAEWRRDIVTPFFNEHLQNDGKPAHTPPVFIYDTGANHWDRLESFPTSCEQGCAIASKPVYLAAGGKLSFNAPAKAAGEMRFTEYVSDPAKPVPYRERPVLDRENQDGIGWREWLVGDQRFVDSRTDVVSFVSEPLTEPMKLSGEPVVHLVASTSGTDSDWVVKVIDVYPDTDVEPASGEGAYPGVVPHPYNMSGYELPMATDIFRGRYRTSFEKPEALKPNAPLAYTFGLPMIERTIPAGHRIMVQVQSSLYPLYDRNPQSFVPNIFNAKPADYTKATQRIWHTSGDASYVTLPIVPVQ